MPGHQKTRFLSSVLKNFRSLFFVLFDFAWVASLCCLTILRRAKSLPSLKEKPAHFPLHIMRSTLHILHTFISQQNVKQAFHVAKQSDAQSPDTEDIVHHVTKRRTNEVVTGYICARNCLLFIVAVIYLVYRLFLDNYVQRGKRKQVYRTYKIPLIFANGHVGSLMSPTKP